MSETVVIGRMPVLALRGMAVFPEQTVHFDVGRVKSALALDAAMKKDQLLFLAPQKHIEEDDPHLTGLYPIGCVAKIKQILKSQGDNIRVLVTGLYRGRITQMHQIEPYLSGTVEKVSEIHVTETLRTKAMRRDANALYSSYLELAERPSQSIQLRMLTSEDCGFIADSIAQNSGIEYPEKAKLLCQLNPIRRLENAVQMLRQEMEMLQLESDIQEKTRAHIDQEQRDYYLREQLRAIREELGEGDDHSEFAEFEKRILLLNLEEEWEKKLLKDLDRLKKQPFGSSEASVLRNYLDTVLDFPWNKTTKESVDIQKASRILEKEHYGLEKVKERILETLAVRRMAPDMPPQIICLVGPPGVGKTSIAYSIARSLNRKMARIALGGVRDEADIRGHR